MSLEGVELRHLRRAEPITGTQFSQYVNVLQYRSMRHEKFEEDFWRDGNRYTRGGMREVWTDWQDVPVVEEP